MSIINKFLPVEYFYLYGLYCGEAS